MKTMMSLFVLVLSLNVFAFDSEKFLCEDGDSRVLLHLTKDSAGEYKASEMMIDELELREEDLSMKFIRLHSEPDIWSHDLYEITVNTDGLEVMAYFYKRPGFDFLRLYTDKGEFMVCDSI